MHHEQIELWQHHHVFNVEKKSIEKRTRLVVVITFATMIAEIFFGWLTHSMALYADGWHMGTHAFALGLSLFAYVLARKYATDDRFTFGAWKIEILGAYTSAVVLGIVGILMILTSVERMIHPLAIQYNEALFVAVIGLLVNVLCAFILNAEGHAHEHHHHSQGHHDHSRDHRDLNQKSAYLHVLADALTSVFAIVALLGAKYYHLNWLDPFMGIVGAGLIMRWSISLLRDTAKILIQRDMDSHMVDEIKEAIESDGDTKICDLHIWQVAQGQYACIISLVAAEKYTIDEFKTRLKNFHDLKHITIEINQCRERTT